ncbi:MAG: hypothetical protein JW838_13360 [Spirochaetes bacterium]|nr:hypothetical protein [Spirochaetota bacterium]
MIRAALTLFFVVAIGIPLQAGSTGFDLGLRYGAGFCSLGQDPFMERTGDHYSFINFSIAGELVVRDIFRVEVDLLFDERGFTKIRGNEARHVLYFLEVPVVLKLYPFKYVYLGTGVGCAFKVGSRPPSRSRSFSGAIMGYRHFVSEKMKNFEVNHVLVLGASVPVYRGLSVIVECRHNYGLTSINSHKNKSVLLPPQDFIERFRTLYLFVGANYRVW